MSIKQNRRNNLRLLAQALGGITELANFLNKSPSQLSHLIGDSFTKNIGDRLAVEIEKAFAKPIGWLDSDYSHKETEIIATAIPPAACYRIPLLKRHEVVQWVLQADEQRLINEDKDYFYTSVAVSSAAYACQMQTDSMESTEGGISFPKGVIVIVDPLIPVRVNNFILVRLERSVEPMLRQVAHRQARVYLQALNARYPLIELQENDLVCGVVKAAMMLRSRW